QGKLPDLQGSGRPARLLFGESFEAIARAAQVVELDPLPPRVDDLHPGGVQRVEEEPALRVGEAAGRQRLVDLVEGEKAPADPTGEERFARLVRAADLQRRHARDSPRIA